MLAAAGRIARTVAVPVTVDVERGYGLNPHTPPLYHPPGTQRA
jgi:2-methylisocitrate lyase-like PEP mutase family enzyme